MSEPRRMYEKLADTSVSLTLIVASTILAKSGTISTETLVGAWGLAGAISGTPIIIRRNGNGRQ